VRPARSFSILKCTVQKTPRGAEEEFGSSGSDSAAPVDIMERETCGCEKEQLVLTEREQERERERERERKRNKKPLAAFVAWSAWEGKPFFSAR
jgi:hypothetical protein